MDFNFSEDQKMLAETVATFAKNDSPVSRFRKLRDEDGIGWEKATWRQMGELGWLSVPFPEELDGFGGSFVDVGLVLQKLAGSLVPEPYLASVVLGGMAVLNAGDTSQKEALLKPMIAGETSLALAYAERAQRTSVSTCKTTATATDSGYKIKGEKVFVLNGHAADTLIVTAMLDGHMALFAVSKGLAKPQTVRHFDGQRGAQVLFDCEVDKSALLAGKAPSEHANVFDRVMDYGAAAAVAQGVGVGQQLLDITNEYLKTREQFGVKIGVFQALQHRMVDMFVELELLKSISLEASVRADEDDDEARRSAVSAAKLQLGIGGKFIAQEAVQLHGGVGVTDEHDIGLYFKRMQVLNALFGDAESHTRRFAQQPSFAEVSA